MSTTKKSIALFAGLSLTASGLMALPAQAANEITLDVSAGTGTTTIVGEQFTLRATVGSSLTSAAYEDVKFKVTNTDGVTLTYYVDEDNSAATAGGGDTYVDGVNTDSGSGATDVIYDGDTSATKRQLLGIDSGSTTAHSVSVMAWIDDDGDSVVDSNEYQSNSLTINWVTVANAGLSTSYTTVPQDGDTTLYASITSSVINVAQVDAGNFGIQFGIYSGSTLGSNTSQTWTLSTGSLSTYGKAATLNSITSASLDGNSGTVTALAASKSYVLRGIYSKDAGTTAWAAFGTADTRALGAVEVSASDSEYEIVADANVTAAGLVRKGYTGNVVYKVTVVDSDLEPLAGKVVRLTTTSTTNASGTLKINGVTVSESATQTHDATTDASGVATFTVVSSTGHVDDLLDVTTITAEGETISSNAANLDWTAASYTLTDLVATVSTDVTRAVNAGESLTINAKALDQWSQALTASDVRVKATASGRTVSVSTDTLADGQMTIAIADGAQTTGDTTVAFTLEELTSGIWGSLVDYTITSFPSSYTIKYYSQTDAVLITANNGTTSDLAAAQTRVTTRAWNTNLDHTVPAVSTFDAGATPGTTLDDETVTISGSVINATTLVSKAGAWINISGDSNILFVVDNVAAFGSLSFYDADGAYSVNAYSNKVLSGSVVTVTSGAASKTTKVSFAAGETNVGSKITFTGPATAKAGDAVQVVATLTDKFGNAVDTDIAGGAATNWDGDGTTDEVGEKDAEISVSVTGPGVTLVTLPTATDSNGQLYVSRLLGSNDTSGTITVTVVYGGADGVIGTGLDDITATHTIAVGAVAPVVATKVNAGSFKGYVAIYARGYEGKRLSAKVGNDWVVVPSIVNNQENGTLFRAVEFTGAGYTIAVRIYIDRVLVDTITVTTK